MKLYSDLLCCSELHTDMNSDVVAKALQRLATRQKQCQYKAANALQRSASLDVDPDLLVAPPAATVENGSGDATAAGGGKNGLYHRVPSSGTHRHHRTHTYDSSEYEVPSRQQILNYGEELQNAAAEDHEAHRGGRSPAKSAALSSTSSSHKLLSLENSLYYQNQQSMIEQSRALLEESKAKHRALVAQTHTMQKQLRGSADTISNSPSSFYNFLSSDPLDQSSGQVFIPKRPSIPHSVDKKMSVGANQTRQIAKLAKQGKYNLGLFY